MSDVNSQADELLNDDAVDVNLAADELLNDETPHEPMPGIIPTFGRHAANLGVGAVPIYKGLESAIGRMVGLSPTETRENKDRGLDQINDIKNFTLDPSDLATAYQEGYGKEAEYQKMLSDKRPASAIAGEVAGNLALLAATPKKFIAPLEAITAVGKGVQALGNLPVLGKLLGYGGKVAQNTLNATPMLAAQTALNPQVPMEQVPQQIKENIALAPLANIGIDSAAIAGKGLYSGGKALGKFVAPDFSIGKKLGEMGINVLGDNVNKATSKFGQYYNNLIDDILNPISKTIETNVAKEQQMMGAAKANYQLAETAIKSQIDKAKVLRSTINDRIDREAAANADDQIQKLQDKLHDLQLAKDSAKLEGKETFLNANTEKGHTKIQQSLTEAEDRLKSNFDLIDDEAKDIKFNINRPVSEFLNDPVNMALFKANPEKAEALQGALQKYLVDPISQEGGVGRDTFKKMLNGLTIKGKRQPAVLDSAVGALFPELAANGSLDTLKFNIRQDQYQQLVEAGRADLADMLMKTNDEFSRYKPLFNKFLPKNEYGELASSPSLMSGVKNVIQSKYNPDISNPSADFVNLVNKIPDEKVKSSILGELESLNLDKINIDELVKSNIEDITKTKKQIDFLKNELRKNKENTSFASEKGVANAAIDAKIQKLEDNLINAKKKLDTRLQQYSIGGKPQENIIDKITAKPNPYDRNEAISNIIRSNDTLNKDSALNVLLDAGQVNAASGVNLRDKTQELNDILGLSQNVLGGFKGALDPSLLRGNLNAAGRITGATTKSTSGIIGNLVGLGKNAVSEPISKLMNAVPKNYLNPLKEIVNAANSNKKQALIYAMLQQPDFRESLQKAGMSMEDFTVDTAEQLYNAMAGVQ